MPRGKLLNGLVTQQKVLRAAVALFLEKGYTRTTTGEIAKAAGTCKIHEQMAKEDIPQRMREIKRRMVEGGECKEK